MMPVCSAAPRCSSYSQIPFHVGTRAFQPFHKAIRGKSVIEDQPFFRISDGNHGSGPSFKAYSTKCMHSLLMEKYDHSGSFDSSIFSPYPNEFDDIGLGFSREHFESEPGKWRCQPQEGIGLYATSDSSRSGVMAEPLTTSYVEPTSAASPSGYEFSNLSDSLNQSSNVLADSVTSASTSNSVVLERSVPVSNMTSSGLNLSESKGEFLSGINESVATSLDRMEDAMGSTSNAIKSSITDSVQGFVESFDSAYRNILLSLSRTKDKAGSELTGLQVQFNGSTKKAGALAIDFLRHSVAAIEDSFGNAASFVVYWYGSAKSLLPADIRNVLNLSEDRITETFRPIGAAFQQVYIVIEELEKNIGLDPNDPIIIALLVIGGSAAVGVSFWLIQFGGYAGNLTPDLALDLLKNDKSAVLIDVRPEDLRGRDGVPDLRRAARSKYASVSLPEIDVSIKKLLKGGKDVNDALLAVVIRNMRIVRDGAKVIVMDANGTQSKAIARSLRKLGVKKPYLVQGGFQEWAKMGLRIKELKPETTLTVLNEEAEAILEDIRPTPALFTGYSLGFAAFVYALLEWEKTLQVIAIIGLGQTLYRRFASYENSEDLKQDFRLLLVPVRLGAQAISWAAGKLEPNKIGLPTSPSSTSVHDRVLQAAAKHESQPSDSEETQDLQRESSAQTTEKLDLSEA